MENESLTIFRVGETDGFVNMPILGVYSYIRAKSFPKDCLNSGFRLGNTISLNSIYGEPVLCVIARKHSSVAGGFSSLFVQSIKEE